MRSASPLGWLRRLGPALAAGGLGAAWAWDIHRRSRHTALLHRTLVDLLLNAMSAGDPATERHSRRVADLTDVLGRQFGISSGARHARLRVAALLHDLGKIDDRFFHIVHSCQPLSQEQRRSIEQHPNESAHILEPMERIHPGITDIVEAHHECWNGKGYPRGLRGEEIPLEARLISVADVFDALTQPRAYRDPLSVDDAMREIRGSTGQRFDPEVVRRVESSPEVLRQLREIAERGRESEAAEQLTAARA